MRNSHAEIYVNSEGVLLVVREKTRKRNRCNFLRRVRSFGSENDPFSFFPSRMKVINLFKAKMEAFRERKSSKVENGPFWLHLDPNFLERDESRFLRFAP